MKKLLHIDKELGIIDKYIKRRSSLRNCKYENVKNYVVIKLVSIVLKIQGR